MGSTRPRDLLARRNVPTNQRVKFTGVQQRNRDADVGLRRRQHPKNVRRCAVGQTQRPPPFRRAVSGGPLGSEPAEV